MSGSFQVALPVLIPRLARRPETATRRALGAALVYGTRPAGPTRGHGRRHRVVLSESLFAGNGLAEK